MSQLQIVTPLAPVHGAADSNSALVNQLLYGELVEVAKTEGDWHAITSVHDGYAGWVKSCCLAPAAQKATHTLAALQATCYSTPHVKCAPGPTVYYGSKLTLTEEQNGFVHAVGLGWLSQWHVSALNEKIADWTTPAERFIGATYFWGGRSCAGIDCSGLVQIALASAGINCPRDSAEQYAWAKKHGTMVDLSNLQRGDLIFWKGHVGIASAPKHIINATDYYMCTVNEPRDEIVNRYAADGKEVTGIFRLNH